MERDFEIRLLICGVSRMFHFRDLRNQEQAEQRARKLAKKKNGKVLSIRKVNIDEWPSGVELMKLEKQPKGLYLGGGVYENDIDLDKMLGLRRNNKNAKNDRRKH
jgi:hypothetical protein